jgi:hypothetical protein
MTTLSNRVLLSKADLAVSDLINDGGYLPKEYAADFVQGVVDESVYLGLIDTRPIRSHTQVVSKIGFSGHVLRAGNPGQALTVTERVKPTTDEVELTTRLFKAQLDIDDETLEDNIEGGTLQSTVLALLKQYVSWDLDVLVAQGNTASTDSFLKLLNGSINTVTTHTVNAGDNYLTSTYLRNALLAIPKKYNQAKARQRWLTSSTAEIWYRDALSDRGDALGALALTTENPITYQGRALVGIPAFPDDIGTGSHCTAVLLCDPQLLRLGIWREIKFETGRNIERGVWSCVITLRCGLTWTEEDGVVKIYNVKVV